MLPLRGRERDATFQDEKLATNLGVGGVDPVTSRWVSRRLTLGSRPAPQLGESLHGMAGRLAFIAGTKCSF